MAISLILLLASLVLPFVVGPILLRRRPGIKADREFVRVTEVAARQHFPANSFRAIAQLEAIGFSLVAHLVSGDEITRLNSMISLLVNRESKTLATVTRVIVTRHAVSRTFEGVSFLTEFADGTEIVTNNSPIVRVLRNLPKRLRLDVPQLRDLWRLHYIHSHYVGKRKDSVAVLPAPGAEISHFHKIHDRLMAEQLAAGYFQFDEQTRRYRHSWRGAIIFAWRVLWPVKPILMSRRRYHGRLIAKAAGISNL